MRAVDQDCAKRDDEVEDLGRGPLDAMTDGDTVITSPGKAVVPIGVSMSSLTATDSGSAERLVAEGERASAHRAAAPIAKLSDGGGILVSPEGGSGMGLHASDPEEAGRVG